MRHHTSHFASSLFIFLDMALYRTANWPVSLCGDLALIGSSARQSSAPNDGKDVGGDSGSMHNESVYYPNKSMTSSLTTGAVV